MRSSKAHMGLRLLKGGVSLVALTALAAAFAAPAMAQDATAPASGDATASADQGTEVVVVGVRRSLKTAQQIKKDADTIVDSITATDIGAFPDKSVSEALQRVAGITVSRFAATSDTAHFSAEPSGVLVRGLSQVRSEFNGRDTFSANSSRGLSWGDVSPELMAGVDTYKNQTADLIEGGISGSINLRTRVPFDSKGQLIAISADYAYNDLSKKGDPDISGIYSNRWDTSAGEFGVMVNYAYSKVETDTQGDQLQRIEIFDKSVFNTPVTAADPLGHAYIPSGVTYHDTLYTRTRKGLAAAAQWQNHDHTFLATLQYNDSSYQNDWEEHYVSASAFGVWQLPASSVQTDTSIVRPMPGTPAFTFRDDGFFSSGMQGQKLNGSSLQGDPGFGMNDAGDPFFKGCANWGSADENCGPNGQSGRQAANVGTGTRYATNTEKTQDTSLNVKWDPSEKLHFNFDLQYVHSTVDNYDITADTATYGDVLFDYAGKYPKITISTPTAADNFAANTGGVATASNYHYNDLMDHAETSEGHEVATKLDAQYNFSEGWLDTLKVGVRYADREQELRWSTYNWNGLVQPWNGPPAQTTCYAVTSACYPKEYETLAFSPDLLGGGLINGSNNNMFVFTSMDAIKDRTGFAQAMNEVSLSHNYNTIPAVQAQQVADKNAQIDQQNAAIDVDNAAHVGQAGYPKAHIAHVTSMDDPRTFPGWTPLCNRNASDPRWAEANPTDPGTGTGCYLQQELTSVSEKTVAAYFELKFGGNDKTLFGKPVSGNVGIRWVQTEDESKGYQAFPGTAWYLGPGGAPPVATPPDPQRTGTANCLDPLPGDPPKPSPGINCVDLATAPNVSNAIEFSKATRRPLDADVVHINMLPSFNIKFNLTDQWILRFAASRAMSRPDMGYFKNFMSISSPSFDANCQTADACIKDGSGKVVDYNPKWFASAGNPGIKSTTADQFDVSVEDYFASVGSFTFDAFYKKFHDYIQFGSYNLAITANGVTENVRINGPINGDGASIRGFEVAYQRFFDFLPSPWNGLGIQTNYTHLSNTGINNTHITNVSGSGDLNTGGSGINSSAANPTQPVAAEAIDPHALEGLSDDSYNIVGMYEKGPWAARLAYNWRSKYLVSASDCCVGLPVWQKQAGFLDGSLRYKVNDNIELNIEGSNLTGTQTVLMQQIEGDIAGKTPGAKPVLMPNAWWKNDRRFQVGIRLKY